MCVHARRMKEGRREKGREEGETNVCGGENAHKKDEVWEELPHLL